jgi:CO/xanthine dehydrogenase Mo-binding subunit
VVTASPPVAPLQSPGSTESFELWLDQPRIDARDKVSGQAKYIEDLPEPPGVAFVAQLRSPYAHARIVSIDSSRAAALPGVLAVLDRERLADFDVHAEDPTTNPELITLDKARYQGDLLAMVAANDLRTARRAVELIEVKYEVLPAVFSADEAFASGARAIHASSPDNLALRDSLEWGDIERGLAEADRIYEGTFTCGQLSHHPMEPAMSFVVSATADSIDFWMPTNNPFDPVVEAAKMFHLSPEQVRVRVPWLGGAFGAKHMSPAIMSAVALSRHIRRPVKLVASEEEGYVLTSSQAATYHGRVGLRADGTVLALDVELTSATGAYLTGGGRVATRNALNSSWGGYRLPHFRVRARTAFTNTVPASYFRNTGKNPTAFAVDALMDEVAATIGVEPIEFRRKNLLAHGERVTERWTLRGEEGPSSTPPLDADFPDLLQRAVESIGWDGRRTPPEQRAAGTSKVRGRGVAASLRHGASPGGRAYAMATLERDGTVRIAHNAPDLGMGSHTMISVVAARTLGIPQSRVRVGIPDTSNDLPFFGANSQRTTVQMGTAVQGACESLKQELLKAAAQAKGGTFEDWHFESGRVARGDESYGFSDVLKLFQGNMVLKGIGSFIYTPTDDKVFGGVQHWAPAAAAAEVEVDTDTGEIRVLKYAAIADAGKALHYPSAQGQVQGGAVMGFGIALLEELRYEDGQLLNGDAFQYRLPLMRDIPQEFHVSIVENRDGPGPFGSKGMAQTSISCVAPAICNAIFDATGVRLRTTPFGPEKLLRALGAFDAHLAER